MGLRPWKSRRERGLALMEIQEGEESYTYGNPGERGVLHLWKSRRERGLKLM